MSYTHEWAYDWARYAAFYKNGVVVELEDKPTTNDEGIISILSTSTGRSSIVESVAHQTEATIIQRYTDQQLELETQGWTLFEICSGEIHLMHHTKMHIEVCMVNGDTFHFTPTRGTLHTGTASSPDYESVAWRLSNADGYKDGVKVEYVTKSLDDCPKNMIEGSELSQVAAMKISPDKPEWKAGELPSTGTVCEVNGDNGWEVVTICGHSLNVKKAFYNNSSGAIGWATANIFRPIPSERDKVIAKAIEGVINTANKIDRDVKILDLSYSERLVINNLYDLGMLIDPDKGEE